MIHTIPIGDLKLHIFSPVCWCKPKFRPGQLIHDAADRRVELERRGIQGQPWVNVTKG